MAEPVRIRVSYGDHHYQLQFENHVLLNRYDPTDLLTAMFYKALNELHGERNELYRREATMKQKLHILAFEHPQLQADLMDIIHA